MVAVFLLFTMLQAIALSDARPKGDEMLDGRIIGGRDTNITEVPWQVGLLRNQLNKWSFGCGGSILSEKYVVTAAHCLRGYNASELRVRVGSCYRDKGGVLHDVKRAVMHPKYDHIVIDYDVGILELKEPIKFGANAKAIKIIDVEPKGGEKTLISGYGRNDTDYGLPEQLQSAEVFIFERAKCRAHYKVIFDLDITPRMICTYTETKTTYKGDSGGPSVVNGKLVGAVSWKSTQNLMKNPSVHANLSNEELRKFIKEQTGI